MFVRMAAPGAGRLTMAALAILLLSPIAEAAQVVIDEAGMNALFSQPSFGNTPISIRFNPAKQIAAPELLVIDNLTELKALYDLATDPAPTVTAFFVDQLNVCGAVELDVNGTWHGCAQLPGHLFVENFPSAQLEPAILMGHELGHTLNLGHEFASPSNLMSVFFPHGPDLMEEQVAKILLSPLVQTDSSGQRFIQITPIAIVSPEPSTLLLLGGALGALFIQAKRSTWIRP
jgi:hypothetical protein